MELIPHNVNIDFVSKRGFFAVFSTVINLASITLLLVWGFNYGVDFAGGTMVEVRFDQPTTADTVRQSSGAEELGGLTIQDIGRDGRTFLLRFKQQGTEVGTVSSTVQAALASSFGEAFETLRVEAVGARVSRSLRQKGFLAVIFATLFMGVYIAFRFEPRFGLGAVIALIHDVLVVTGALILTQISLDLPVLAGILTVVGFSVNDTIIVSDRIRENQRKMRRDPLAVVINRSINETLSRTIITAGTSILVLIVLLVYGGHVIWPFAFTLLVGFTTGVYSSIYIATPVVLYFEKISLSRRRRR